MKKRVASLFMAMALLVAVSIPASASQSLDSILGGETSTSSSTEAAGETDQTQEQVQNTQGTQGTVGNNTDGTTGGESGTSGSTDTNQSQENPIGEVFDRENKGTSGSDFIDELGNAADLTEPDIEGVQPITNGIRNVAAALVQVLSVFLALFIAVGIILDLIYINVSFTRGFLAGGASPQGAVQGPGMGGFNSGYNNNYNSGYSGYNSGAMQSQPSGGGLRSMQFVSNAAMAAAASEGQRGEANKTYLKSVVGKCILVPVIVVLTATGVMQQFGFIIGGFLSDAISNIGSMI